MRKFVLSGILVGRKEYDMRYLRYLVGILTFPAPFVYLLSFRLVGAEVTYHWPNPDISIQRATRGQFTLGRLLPLVVLVPLIILLRIATTLLV